MAGQEVGQWLGCSLLGNGCLLGLGGSSFSLRLPGGGRECERERERAASMGSDLRPV